MRFPYSIMDHLDHGSIMDLQTANGIHDPWSPAGKRASHAIQRRYLDKSTSDGIYKNIRICISYIDFRDAPAWPNVYRWFKIWSQNCHKSQSCNARIWDVQRLYSSVAVLVADLTQGPVKWRVNLRYETGGGARNDIHINWHDTSYFNFHSSELKWMLCFHMMIVVFVSSCCRLSVSRDHIATRCTSGAL